MSHKNESETKHTDTSQGTARLVERLTSAISGFDIHPEHQPNTATSSEQTKATGIKFDAGKPPLSWIPRTALEQESLVFLYGANKYGRNNYKAGMKWTRLLDACMRHVVAFANGEDVDPESGLSHLAHAKASLSMIMFYIEHKRGEDDRGE